METPGITTQPINNAALPGVAAPKTEGQQAEANTERVAAAKESAEPVVDRDEDALRFEAVKQAARRNGELRANPYIVGDERFTIYRDINEAGVYVTRFTNLKDGSVRVVREPELLSQATGGGTLVDGRV